MEEEPKEFLSFQPLAASTENPHQYFQTINSKQGQFDMLYISISQHSPFTHSLESPYESADQKQQEELIVPGFSYLVAYSHSPFSIQGGVIPIKLYRYNLNNKEGKAIDTKLRLQVKGEVSILKIFLKDNQLYCLLCISDEDLVFKMLSFQFQKREWTVIKNSELTMKKQDQDLKKITQKDKLKSFVLRENIFLFAPNEYCRKIIKEGEEKQYLFKRVYTFSLTRLFWRQITSNIQIPLCSIISQCNSKGRLFFAFAKKQSDTIGVIEIEYECFNEECDPQFISHEVGLEEEGPLFSQAIRLFEIQKKLILVANCQINEYWLLDVASEFWVKLNEPNRLASIMCANEQKSLIYAVQKDSGLLMKCEPQYLLSLPSIIAKRFPQPQKCQICYEYRINKNQLMQPAFKLSKIFLDNLVDQIDFPFHAFGLLADSSSNFYATHFKVTYMLAANRNAHPQSILSEPCLFFQDDAKLNLTNQELEEVLVNFQGFTNYNFNSIEKRTRSYLHKEALKKQFGINIKIASFRLGSCALFVSVNQNLEARVAYFTVQEQECVCYYYVYDLKTERTAEGYSDEVRFQVEAQFQHLLDIAYDHLKKPFPKYPQWRNCLWILDLKKVKSFKKREPKYESFLEYELLPNQLTNDIMYIPNRSAYKKLLKLGIPVNTLVDVSLVEFMNHLYLKNEHLKLYVGVEGSENLGQQNPLILPPGVLGESYQKLINPTQISQLTQSVKYGNNACFNINRLFSKFQLKSIHLICNPNLNRTMPKFNSGILFYYRNRLIRRFQIPLGEILWHLQRKISQLGRGGYFRIFGLLEFPDCMDVNLFKNDFLQNVLVQKLDKRCLFVSKAIGKVLQTDANKREIGKRIIEIDDDEHHEPQKKVKLSKQE